MRNQEAHHTSTSIIVPVYNGSMTLGLCLKALVASLPERAEIIVVDDHSTDDSVKIASAFSSVRVVHNTGNRGPAAARNLGADTARGDILVFIDADVVVHPDTIDRVQATFGCNPDAAAIFGSYDDSPHCPNFLSQYKNLFHHYIHQNSSENASTFWAGCGAIRKSIFKQAGGFNEKHYRNASIEDVELGMRLTSNGYRIVLDKQLQVQHLKRWTPAGLLRADILYRALPWTRLAATGARLPADLNFQMSHRVSAVLSALLVGLLLIAAFVAQSLSSSQFLMLSSIWSITLIVFLFLNRNLYRFFLKKRGFFFAMRSVCWHFFYYLYSGATFALFSLYYRLIPGNDRVLQIEGKSVAGTL